MKLFRPRAVLPLLGSALLLAVLRPLPAAALSQPLAAFGLPWEDRIEREGLTLKVEFEPVRRGAREGALREGDRVAFRFRLADEAGQPLGGLRPTVWLDRLEAGETVDPVRCVEEVEGTAGWTLVRQAALDLDVREESRPGTYESVARLAGPGRYQVAFFLGSPRLAHCFEVEVSSGSPSRAL